MIFKACNLIYLCIIFFFIPQTAIALLIVVNAEEKVSKNATKADTIKTKDTREKRNLNLFGNFDNNSNLRNYNYQPNGYSKYTYMIVTIVVTIIRLLA